MKIRPEGAELFHTDGRTDMVKLICRFCNFAKATQKLAMTPELGTLLQLTPPT